MQLNKIALLIPLCAALCACGSETASNAPRDSSAPLTATPAPLPDVGAIVKRMITQRSEEHTSELQSHRDLPSFPTRRSSDLSETASNAPRDSSAPLTATPAPLPDVGAIVKRMITQ